MDWLTFIASVIGDLAWPATSLAVVFMLRGPITKLLPDLRKLKYEDLEVDFGRGLERAGKQLDEFASPTTVVIEQ